MSNRAISAADLLHARAAARHCRVCADRLEGEALVLQAANRPMSARIYRWWATIARRAAAAEETE